jgi:DNA-binding transcriptional MerR regulator
MTLKPVPKDSPKGESSPMYTISGLADEFGITPRTIRYYEEVGLLTSHRSTPTSHRLYDSRDRGRLKLILRGKRFGYSLAELAEILHLYDVDPTQKKQIKRTLEMGIKHLEEINEKIEELEELREEMIEFALSFLEIISEEKGDESDEMKAFIAGARAVVESMHGK